MKKQPYGAITETKCFKDARAAHTNRKMGAIEATTMWLSAMFKSLPVVNMPPKINFQNEGIPT
jgi:hypothetical protein